MTTVPFPEIAPRLLAAPMPLPEESLASWIQRVAGAHQYSMPRLKEVLAVDVVGNDWDTAMGEASWNRIVQVMGIDPGPQRRALRALSLICTAHPAPSLLLTSGGKPRYRWCVRCLASDHAPYLRWHWRLAEVERCWTHALKLADACPWCQAPMQVHRARLVMVGRGGWALTLADCDLCGGPLTVSRAKLNSSFTAYQWHLRNELNPFRGIGGEVPMQLAHATVDRFLAVVRDKHVVTESPGQKQEAEVKKRKANARSRALACNDRLRVLREKNLEWRLNANSFVISPAAAAPLSRRVMRWSWSLSAEGRCAVAKALWAVRSEMRSAPIKQREGLSP